MYFKNYFIVLFGCPINLINLTFLLIKSRFFCRPVHARASKFQSFLGPGASRACQQSNCVQAASTQLLSPVEEADDWALLESRPAVRRHRDPTEPAGDLSSVSDAAEDRGRGVTAAVRKDRGGATVVENGDGGASAQDGGSPGGTVSAVKAGHGVSSVQDGGSPGGVSAVRKDRGGATMVEASHRGASVQDGGSPGGVAVMVEARRGGASVQDDGSLAGAVAAAVDGRRRRRSSVDDEAEIDNVDDDDVQLVDDDVVDQQERLARAVRTLVAVVVECICEPCSRCLSPFRADVIS